MMLTLPGARKSFGRCGESWANAPGFTVTTTGPNMLGAYGACQNPDPAGRCSNDPAFAIDGLPHWAGFDEITGELYGTPDVVHIGLYEAITIWATDGVVETSLPSFSIEVIAPGAALGAVTLSWTPPMQNEDGSYLTDLAGYWIYWGNNPGTYTNWMRIDDAGLTMLVIEDLVPGSWEFAMTSFNAAGVESSLSNTITRFVE